MKERFLILIAGIILATHMPAKSAPHAQHCMVVKDPCMVIDCLQQEKVRNAKKIA